MTIFYPAGRVLPCCGLAAALSPCDIMGKRLPGFSWGHAWLCDSGGGERHCCLSLQTEVLPRCSLIDTGPMRRGTVGFPVTLMRKAKVDFPVILTGKTMVDFPVILIRKTMLGFPMTQLSTIQRRNPGPTGFSKVFPELFGQAFSTAA